MKKIGFIGLGIMGKPMARNLLKAGYDLVVYDVRPEPLSQLQEDGAAVGTSSMDVASRAELVISMVPNSPEVEEVALGTEGIINGAKPGTIYVDMSSIAPLVAQHVASRLKEKEITMLDAPVSGGEPKAIDGTLALMVGGPASAFERVKDVLSVMGASVTRVGEIGSGNTTKLANQIIVALNISAMSEAMVLATKAGVEPQKVFEAIRGGLAGSTVLDAKMPMVLQGNFEPGFRIELHIKDLVNALETASKIDVPVPLSKQVLDIMQRLNEDGHGKDDHGGLIQYYENLAEVEVRT